MFYWNADSARSDVWIQLWEVSTQFCSTETLWGKPLYILSVEYGFPHNYVLLKPTDKGEFFTMSKTLFPHNYVLLKRKKWKLASILTITKFPHNYVLLKLLGFLLGSTISLFSSLYLRVSLENPCYRPTFINILWKQKLGLSVLLARTKIFLHISSF